MVKTVKITLECEQITIIEIRIDERRTARSMCRVRSHYKSLKLECPTAGSTYANVDLTLLAKNRHAFAKCRRYPTEVPKAPGDAKIGIFK